MSRKVWISVAVAIIAAAVAIAAVYQYRRSETELKKNAVPPVKLVVGTPWIPVSGSVILAKQLGFFRDEGLDVTLQPYQLSNLALTDLLKGKPDLAFVNASAIVLAALTGARFHMLATVYESDNLLKMVGRRDRGIEKPQNLAGKKLGSVFGTPSEFIQDSILALHKVDPESVARVNFAPVQTVNALIGGEVDAVTIWAPYSLELIKRLGDTAVVFSDKAIYTSTLNLVAGEQLLKRQPEVLRRVLAALLRANAFARSDSDRAARVLAQALELDEAVVTADWNPLNFTLELNQSFIISLEEQARWAIRRRLVEATAVPNFMEWIHADALAAVKPDAVSVTK